jgi:hypothetical protein
MLRKQVEGISMNTLLQSHPIALLCGVVLIAITSLYLIFAVRPLYQSAGPAWRGPIAQPARPDTIEALGLGDGASEPSTLAGAWSTLAVLCLGLPFAVALAFSATNSRRALSLAERVVWLSISLLSLALFFLTANTAQVLFDQLLG